MFATRAMHASLYVFAILVMFIIMTWLTGCSPLRKMDETLWGAIGETFDPDTGEVTVTHDPGTAAAPPILEGIAASLAALGFPGMAYWIHRNKRNGVGQLTEHTKSLSDLTLRLVAIEARLDAARSNGKS